MTILALSCLAFVAYTYLGYAILLRMVPRPKQWAPSRPGTGGDPPTVSIVIAACNEAANIGAKLDNLAVLDYPKDRLEILIGSDGSTDGTDDIVRDREGEGVRLLRTERLGKTGVLNRLVAGATGDILVFMDARQRVDRDALRRFAAWFENPDIGAVGGELALLGADGRETSAGVGVYWKYEKWLRLRESDLGLLTGLSGALYAMRRELYVSPPDEAILDDVMIPLAAARIGRRLVVDPSIKMYDDVADEEKEFRRKVRTLLGNFQTFGWLLKRPSPFPARLAFSLVSHKACRVLTPAALVGLLVGSLGMPGGPGRTALLAGQGVVYGLGLTGLALRGRLRSRLVSVCSTFCVLNAAAGVALFRYATGRYRTAWK